MASLCGAYVSDRPASSRDTLSLRERSWNVACCDFWFKTYTETSSAENELIEVQNCAYLLLLIVFFFFFFCFCVFFGLTCIEIGT